ncbi:MAG: hypothetical protein A2171_02010 [Candidatus Levybacteria bacterium RBG_13_35_9]|nr:MAG: hypothetical protein A2171_02010 [Candidatus Levybacteria bacterium RBG_13_35_9]
MKPIEKQFLVPKGYKPEASVTSKIHEFIKVFQTLEGTNGVPLFLMLDKRSKAFYINCHLDAKIIVSKADLDAVLDPTESEDYKLNREIYTDTYAYRLMEDDALSGRSFEDLVVEYDTSYRNNKPLKVFGGQHRIKAIAEAIKKNVSVVHGIRIYFCLSIEQKVNIAMANNTSITVSNDLLDRMQEDLLGADLRNWCQNVGLLSKGQNFVDRRSPEGIPTVRIARTLLINFHLGQKAKKGVFCTPVVCLSGPGIDEHYKNLRDNINWGDNNLKIMGQQFSHLHNLQRKRVLSRAKDKYIEFANKVTHPCVAASWAFAAGALLATPRELANHYALSQISTSDDPLNAKALLNARLKGVDPDTYRGLGSRINNVELGRMLEVFLLQATKATERGITQQLANAAIKSYEAKRAKIEADKALTKI